MGILTIFYNSFNLMDDKIIVQLDQNAIIEETEKSMQASSVNLEEEEKKPLDERVISKEWKIRKNAYVEVLARLTSETESDTNAYKKYYYCYNKVLDESNPTCQENCVDIIKFLVEKCNADESYKSDLFKQLIEKLCQSQKTQCKNKAKELVLYIYETSKDHPALIEGLVQLIDNVQNKKKIVKCR
jgi:hypothetical protein